MFLVIGYHEDCRRFFPASSVMSCREHSIRNIIRLYISRVCINNFNFFIVIAMICRKFAPAILTDGWVNVRCTRKRYKGAFKCKAPHNVTKPDYDTEFFAGSHQTWRYMYTVLEISHQSKWSQAMAASIYYLNYISKDILGVLSFQQTDILLKKSQYVNPLV